MDKHFYGNLIETKINNNIDKYIEQLDLKGFLILEDILSLNNLTSLRSKIDEIYYQQRDFLGKEFLLEIQDVDMCRAPLLYDADFLSLITQPLIIQIIKQYLGCNIILNLQNAIINRPKRKHHQAIWHRDIPYQNFLTSKPISINAFFIIDEFSKKTGATKILPYSHKFENLPSQQFLEENSISIEASPGSVILFDSMLFHCAGENNSNLIRRAINHMYTIPLYKQQYDFSRAFDSRSHILSDEEKKILGFEYPVPFNDIEWRKLRGLKILKKNNMSIDNLN